MGVTASVKRQSMLFTHFVIIGDAARPAVAPRNVRFETISFLDMQKRAAQLLPQSDQHLVDYGDVHYKANDLKPFVAHLFPTD